MNNDDLNNFSTTPTDNQSDNLNQTQSQPRPGNNEPTSISFEQPKSPRNLTRLILIGIIAVIVAGGLIFGAIALFGSKDDNNTNQYATSDENDDSSEPKGTYGMQPLEKLIKSAKNSAEANIIYKEYSDIRRYSEDVQQALNTNNVKNIEIPDLANTHTASAIVATIFEENSIQSLTTFDASKKYSAKVDSEGVLYIYIDGILFNQIEGSFKAVQEWRQAAVDKFND